MTDHVYIMGYPGDIGGACTETWHTVKLFRRFGLRVTCIPTWKTDDRWRRKLDGIGCKTLAISQKDLTLPDGAIVVAFCNHPFLHYAGQLGHTRTVWVPCMDYVCDLEEIHYRKHPAFDKYVFQSEYQKRTLLPQLTQFGVTHAQCHRIPGAFDVDEFPFQPKPHHNGDPFVVGRLSRSDPRKFAANTWEVYEGIPNVQARVMGWSEIVEQKLGKPPAWAEVLPKGAESALDFYRSLHALVHPGGEAVENWPRFVLEAMAAGVPVVTDDCGGTREMIRPGMTGFLYSDARGLSGFAKMLSEREDLRMDIASRARNAVEELADPDTIWAGWSKLLEDMA